MLRHHHIISTRPGRMFGVGHCLNDKIKAQQLAFYEKNSLYVVYKSHSRLIYDVRSIHSPNNFKVRWKNYSNDDPSPFFTQEKLPTYYHLTDYCLQYLKIVFLL